MVDKAFRIHTGQRLLRGLFYETTLSDKTTVIYTLKDRDHEGYNSLYRLYMEMDDPTEYLFAIAYLDGWDHWTVLCQCSWFKSYVARWRKELEVRAKAKALLAIKALADNPTSKEHYQASKCMLTGGWKDKSGRGAGRPSKEDVQKEARRIAQDHQNIEDDYTRTMGVAH